MFNFENDKHSETKNKYVKIIHGLMVYNSTWGILELTQITCRK